LKHAAAAGSTRETLDHSLAAAALAANPHARRW
jgi:hypothetical protein